MIIYVPTNVIVLGNPVNYQLPLDISLKDKRLVVNGYSFSTEETKGIVGFFSALEKNL